jgi:hypothetical protein
MNWLSAAGLAMVIAGCGPKGGSAGGGYVQKSTPPLASAMLQPGQEANYFPLAVGNQWTFASTMVRMMNGRQQQSLKQDLTYRVVTLTPVPGGGQDAVFDVLDGGDVVDKQIWRLDKNGFSQVAIGKKLNKFSSPQVILPFPVKTGTAFHWKGSISADNGEVRTGTNDGKVVGEEAIDTETGSFNAVAVEAKGTLKTKTTDSQIASKLWLVPNVGIGRYRQEAVAKIISTDPKLKGKSVTIAVSQTMMLKNFQPKK